MKGKHIPYVKWPNTPEESAEFFQAFERAIQTRRSVRFFSDAPVPKETIDKILAIGNNAPSGANKQPWHFAVVSNPEIKRKIRLAAEEEEKQFYGGRASEEWLKDLEPFGTDWQKPFLERAPWLIIVFRESYELDAEGNKKKNYYAQESVGIATGFLISAIHAAGLSTLTHTPAPMDFLSELLERPVNEKAFVILPVGYAETDATVPDLTKKGLDEKATYF